MDLIVCKVTGDELFDPYAERMLEILDNTKRQQIDNYVHYIDKSRTFLANLIVYAYFNGNVKYVYNKYGKIKNRLSTKCFNISHAGDYVAVAFDDNEIGLDIEKIGIISESDKQTFCSKSELNDFKSSKEITELWCLKESYLKYDGIGLSDDVTKIEFEKNNDRITCLNDKKIQFVTFQLDSSHIGALAYDGKTKLKIKYINFEELKKLIIK